MLVCRTSVRECTWEGKGRKQAWVGPVEWLLTLWGVLKMRHTEAIRRWGLILLHRLLDAVTCKGSLKLGEVSLFSWAVQKGVVEE